MIFTEEQINSLRERVSAQMSDFRFVHTAEVEKMAERLGRLYAPDKLDLLRAAALLHDVTKELKPDAQIQMLSDAGEFVSEFDIASPKILHARTAPLEIKQRYAEFAHPELLDAVRYHTTGRADMSVCECVIFLADYIDESRKFDDCVYLRNYFWSAEPEKMDAQARLKHLYETMIKAFDLTVAGLVAEKSLISAESIEARNSLILKL